MFGTNQNPTRPVGVRIPEGQLQPDEDKRFGPPKTVKHAARCEFVAVEYYDVNGKSHTDVFLRAGDAYYQPPNSEQWAGALRPTTKWLADGINTLVKVQETPDALHAEDTVDVMEPTK